MFKKILIGFALALAALAIAAGCQSKGELFTEEDEYGFPTYWITTDSGGCTSCDLAPAEQITKEQYEWMRNRPNPNATLPPVEALPTLRPSSLDGADVAEEPSEQPEETDSGYTVKPYAGEGGTEGAADPAGTEEPPAATEIPADVPVIAMDVTTAGTTGIALSDTPFVENGVYTLNGIPFTPFPIGNGNIYMCTNIFLGSKIAQQLIADGKASVEELSLDRNGLKAASGLDESRAKEINDAITVVSETTKAEDLANTDHTLVANGVTKVIKIGKVTVYVKPSGSNGSTPITPITP